jgi:plastocyanin
MKKIAAFAATLAMALAPFASQAAVTSSFSPGDLIKGSGSAVYYFAADGHRYVFPNAQTYFTWYKDFSGVKQIPDSMLAQLPLARQNVTYRPGRKMIKITTDPSVYVVDRGGVLRHVGSEQLAQTLYGLSWKGNVDDVADAFFVNYKVGTGIDTAGDFKPADVMTITSTIAQDKGLDDTKATVTISSTTNGFVPSSMTVKKGTTVTWTNGDLGSHSVVGSGWSSGALSTDQTYSHTFPGVGSFDYKDAGSSMQGTINVVQ